MKRFSFHHYHNNHHHNHQYHHHDQDDHHHHHNHDHDKAKVQLLGVARRNGASLGEETLDSLIATNIQVLLFINKFILLFFI